MKHDLLIVGGGIVGSACAYLLSSAGLKVGLVRARVVGDATAAGMGHLVVIDDDPALLALTHLGRSAWEALASELPEAAQWATTGTLWIAEHPDEVREAETKMQRLRAAGVTCDWLTSQQLQREEAVLRPGLLGAMRVPDDRVVYPPVAAAWLLARAQSMGAQVYEGEVVSRRPGQVRLADGREINCETQLLCTGLATARLVAVAQREQVPLRARKGHLLITDRHAPACGHQLVELGYARKAHGDSASSIAFNLQPRTTGQWLLGSSRQFAEAEQSLGPEVERALVARMIERGLEFVPALAGCTATRVWTGARACTPDKLPLIGALDTDAQTLIATGHEGLGITTALSTAMLVRAQLLDEPAPMDPRPFSPGRFVRARAQHVLAGARAHV